MIWRCWPGQLCETRKFRELCSSPSLQVDFTYPVKQVTYTNHNRLLTEYAGCVGVKTGFTKQAGRCLVSAAERDGALLIAVTLNDPDDWRDHTVLLDYGFSQVEPYLLAGGDVSLTVPVVGSEIQYVSLKRTKTAGGCFFPNGKRQSGRAGVCCASIFSTPSPKVGGEYGW